MTSSVRYCFSSLVFFHVLEQKIFRFYNHWIIIWFTNLCDFLFHLDTDLHAVIKKGGILKDIHKRYIMYQLINASMYIHSGNVIHRDQKVSFGVRGYLLETDPDPIVIICHLVIRVELFIHKPSKTNANLHCIVTHARLCYRYLLSAGLVDE